MKKTTQFTTTTRKGFYFILLLSAIAISGLLFIIYGKESGQSDAIASEFLSYFVLLNIFLNSASSFCILCGFRAIRLRRIAVHKKFMLLAFTFSALFLISYIYYHYNHGILLLFRENISNHCSLKFIFSTGFFRTDRYSRYKFRFRGIQHISYKFMKFSFFFLFVKGFFFICLIQMEILAVF